MDSWQMAIPKSSQSVQKPTDSSSAKLELKKPLKMKKKPKSPKSETKKVYSDQHPSKTKRCKSKRVLDDLYEDSEIEASKVMERAEEIQKKLDPKFPSFIKLMRRSHVTKGFWLGLPSDFCKMHLPQYDEAVFLQAESGKEYKTNFLAVKCGLSGGWKGFSAAHELVEGDVVVFQLVNPNKFKIYIARNDLAELEGTLGLLNLDVSARESDSGGHKNMYSRQCRKAGEKHPRPLVAEICQNKIQKTTSAINLRPWPVADQTDSIVMNNDKFPCSFVDFKNFEITLHGSSIDSQMEKLTRRKYYKLCCTQKSYLHHHLVKSVNSTLAVGIISETVNIADAIRSCEISTSPDALTAWDKTLEAIELLGMEVGFLRVQLNRLLSLLSKPQKAKRIMEARLERDHVEDEVNALELLLQEFEETRDKLDEEIKDLELDQEITEAMFVNVANTPW